MCSVVVLFSLVCTLFIQSFGGSNVNQDLKFITTSSLSTVIPPSLDQDNFFKTRLVSSTVTCSSLCGFDSNCLAFYVTANPMTSSSRDAFQCWLLSQRLDDTRDLTNGVGTYGYLSELTVYISPPQPFSLGGGTFQRITRTQYGPAAVFDCSSVNSKMTDMGLINTGLDSDNTVQWPELSPQCSNSICDQLGLSGTLLNISKGSNPDTFDVKPICKQDETFYSDAHCDISGQWTFTTRTILQVGCVPTRCNRVNSIGKGIYKGTLAVSKLGSECQAWDVTTPTNHYQHSGLFDEEDYNRTAARNYCRDPDKEGQPWCYQMTYIGNYKWQFCTIPACQGGFL